MIYLYAILKYLTFPGSIIRATIEHTNCRKFGIPIEDDNPLRFDDLCGHVEHELPKDLTAAARIVLRPFIFNLVVGFFILFYAAVAVFMAGDFSLVDLFLLWLGISLWSNVFPSLEVGSYYLYLARSQGKGISKAIAGFMRVGAALDTWCLSLPLALVFAYILPIIFKYLFVA